MCPALSKRGPHLILGGLTADSSATLRTCLKRHFLSENLWRTALVAGSIALNLLLLLLLAHSGRPNATPPDAPSPGGAPAHPLSSVRRVNRAAPPTERLEPAPPFHWSELESTSYADYIARLRGIGCPESVVRDIITADINQLYSTRAREIWTPPKREYWQKARETDRPNPDQLKRLMQLGAERQELQQVLLGTGVRDQELIDLTFLQLHGIERTLAWLPEERRTAAWAALERSGYMAEEEKQQLTAETTNPMEKIKALQETQSRILRNVLTPDELKEFRMRTSPEADVLRSELRYFDATQTEFDALVDLHQRRAQEKAVTIDFYAGKAEECAAARQVLGEERGREYECKSDLFYVWSRDAAERYGAPEERAAEAWAVKRDSLSSADQLRRDASLNEVEKKRRLTELRNQAEARLDQILGPKAAAMAKRGDGVWLQIMPQRLQP
jgi:hypothetical protein